MGIGFCYVVDPPTPSTGSATFALVWPQRLPTPVLKRCKARQSRSLQGWRPSGVLTSTRPTAAARQVCSWHPV
jgi:hypothetical protein